MQKGRGEPFLAVRKQHLKESAEDYTELIADLIQQKGEARTCEIARNMNISHVSAVKALRRLQREGYLETTPHQPVVLTSKGEQLAAFAKERHVFLLEFFTSLGVPEEIAAVDVEGMEHHISIQTLEALKKHLQKMKAQHSC